MRVPSKVRTASFLSGFLLYSCGGVTEYVYHGVVEIRAPETPDSANSEGDDPEEIVDTKKVVEKPDLCRRTLIWPCGPLTDEDFKYYVPIAGFNPNPPIKKTIEVHTSIEKVRARAPWQRRQILQWLRRDFDPLVTCFVGNYSSGLSGADLNLNLVMLAEPNHEIFVEIRGGAPIESERQIRRCLIAQIASFLAANTAMPWLQIELRLRFSAI